MTQGPLRGALVGAGRVSTFHLRAWAAIPQAAITCIADPDIERARQQALAFGIPAGHVYTDIESLLAAESALDFVDITTRPAARLDPIRAAAERGLAISCQKPLARSIAEAQQLIALCEAHAAYLHIHENWRWRSWYRRIRKLLAEGLIGRPLYARFAIHSASFTPEELRRNTDPHHILRDLGIVMEWGIHHLDVMRFLFGEPDSVFMRANSLNPDLYDVEDRALVLVNFPGFTALLDISASSFAPYAHVRRTGPMVEDMRIEGSRGAIVLTPDTAQGDRIRVVTEHSDEEGPAYPGSPESAYQASYTAAHQHFIDCWQAGRLTETHPADNLRTLQLTLAALESARCGELVTLAEFAEVSSR